MEVTCLELYLENAHEESKPKIFFHLLGVNYKFWVMINSSIYENKVLWGASPGQTDFPGMLNFISGSIHSKKIGRKNTQQKYKWSGLFVAEYIEVSKPYLFQ